MHCLYQELLPQAETLTFKMPFFVHLISYPFQGWCLTQLTIKDRTLNRLPVLHFLWFWKLFSCHSVLNTGLSPFCVLLTSSAVFTRTLYIEKCNKEGSIQWLHYKRHFTNAWSLSKHNLGDILEVMMWEKKTKYGWNVFVMLYLIKATTGTTDNEIHRNTFYTHKSRLEFLATETKKKLWKNWKRKRKELTCKLCEKKKTNKKMVQMLTEVQKSDNRDQLPAR